MSSRVIVIPAYNEEKTIGAVIQSVVGLCNFVVVVDDCSNDKTNQIVRKFNRVIIVKNQQNLGYSKSLEIGISKAVKAGGKYIMTLDADGQHPIEEIELIFSKIKSQKLDMVIAVRDKLPRLSESMVAAISKFIWGIGDITCGMKCYKNTLVSTAGIPKKFNSTGTFLTFFALFKGYKFDIVKIKASQRIGKSRYGAGVKTELKLLITLIRGFLAAKRQ